MFNDLKNDGLEESQDRLGGFQVYESDIYLAKIKVAYGLKSSGGAKGVAFTFDLGNGKEYRETIYVTDKKGQNFFLNKDDNSKKVPLPGFTTVEDICLIVTGKTLSEQEMDDKVFNVYDPDARQEMPKSVPTLVELLDQPIYLAIIKAIENKNAKDSSGRYVPTAETRETNSIEKVFHPEEKMTVAEARDGKETAGFFDAWLTRNKGKDRDKRKVKGGQAGVAGKPGSRAPSGPPQAGAPQTGRKSLFGSKS